MCVLTRTEEEKEEELVGEGDDAKERRRRAKEVGEVAHKAFVKKKVAHKAVEGGSSHSNIILLIEDIMEQVKSRN
ncbi:hypothetical protein F2Q68_00001496 [Brassica cretica]|uniref:Uncharacterized protein n=1 Tax=Brassica cretica TaxID=69181 RepID=A0A8S9J3U1_BRACR|nr:hypothetical protein F2Q68_00001496 [Brassica cretica]